MIIKKEIHTLTGRSSYIIVLEDEVAIILWEKDFKCWLVMPLLNKGQYHQWWKPLPDVPILELLVVLGITSDEIVPAIVFAAWVRDNEQWLTCPLSRVLKVTRAVKERYANQ